MRTKTKYKVNAIAPRLSDEDPDPIEQDDSESATTVILIEGWLPWDQEDIQDIKKLIALKMPQKQRYVIESFLEGLSYSDAHVTEKYWRYHFNKAIDFIKKELKV